MKTFDELTKEEISELKEQYFCGNHDHPSLEQLANIDNLVSIEELRSEFEGYSFSDDDFFCNSKNNDYEM